VTVICKNQLPATPTFTSEPNTWLIRFSIISSCALITKRSQTQIGHTKCAAGLAGLIKAAMSVYTGIKPPTLHLDEPNSAWQEETSPFAFHSRARPWAVRFKEWVCSATTM